MRSSYNINSVAGIMAGPLLPLLALLVLLGSPVMASAYTGSPSFVRQYYPDKTGYYPHIVTLSDGDIIFAY